MGLQRLTKGKGLIGNGFNPTVRRIKITTTPTGSEQDTGYDLPSKAIVLGVYLDVTTAEATGATTTLNVGLVAGESGGDADGFLAAVECNALGLVKGTLATAGQTLGELMTVDSSGGVLVPEPHLTDEVTAKSLAYTSSAADWAEFRGAIYIEFIEI